MTYSPLIKTEGFLVQEGFSKGVMIQGVETHSFSQVSGLEIALSGNEIAIGKALAQLADLRVGDEVILVLAIGKKQLSTMPTLHRFRLKQIVDHQIYSKSMRLIYVNLKHLQSLLGLREEKINMVSLNKFTSIDADLVAKVKALKVELTDQLLDPFMVIHPFWQEFTPLLEAVVIEKMAMTLTLQLIVIIAIFNVVAFVIFLN